MDNESKQNNNKEYLQTEPVKGKPKKKKPGNKKGIRAFFSSKAGRNLCLILEVLLLAAFIAMPDLYYDPTVFVFWDRFYADSIIICGGLWIILVFLTVKKVELTPKWNHTLTITTALMTPLVAFFWLEVYNDMQFWAPMTQIPLLYLFLDFLVYCMVYLLLLLVFNCIKHASIAMIVLTSFFGILNYELTIFRGMSIIASDIYSILTAVSVANTYDMQIDVDTAEFFMLTLVLLALLLKLKKEKFLRWKGRLAYLMLTVVLMAGFLNVYVFSDYLENIGVDFRVYRPQYKYRFYGTMLTTMRTFGYLNAEEPEGYSYNKVSKIIESYRAEKEVREKQAGEEEAAAGKPVVNRVDKDSGSAKKKMDPNVIVIMNESFADLQVLGDMQVTHDYMPFFRSLKKNTIKGWTYSSVFGGNTANSEFEFLTGNTMGFLPDNSVPYQLFLRDETAGLTYTLKDQDYSPCFAMHPYFQTGYSRYKVYPLMGFDRFYTSDDFSVFTPTVNYHITDSANYEKLIRIYKKRKEKDKPFYMFNVTMQNHGSYDGSLVETGDAVRLQGSLQFFTRTQQFLNMIRMSDDALRELIEYFDSCEEPTVILFFGDHQPDLDESFYNTLLGKEMEDLEGEELEQIYKVPFLIWANYDIQEQTVERTSMNYLSTYLAEAAGFEKTDYLQYLTDLREEIPAINALGYWGADGKYYDLEDKTSPYYDKLLEYSMIQYNNLFGKEDQISSFFYLDRPDHQKDDQHK